MITLGTLYIYRGIFLPGRASDCINASDLPREFLDARHPAYPARSRCSSLVAVVVLAVVGYLHADRPRRPRALRDRLRPRRRELYGLQGRRRVLGAFVTAAPSPVSPASLYTARYGTISSNAGLRHRA